MSNHHTIYPLSPDNIGNVYHPGHNIGSGWTRHIVEVPKGDTADNPSSTKRVLHGPMLAVYDVSPMGIRTTTYESAEGFYKAIVDFRLEQIERDLRNSGRLLGDDPISA